MWKNWESMVWDAVEMAGLVMTSMSVFSFICCLQGNSRIWTKRQQVDLQRASYSCRIRGSRRPCEVSEPNVCPVFRLKWGQVLASQLWGMPGYSALWRFQWCGHILSLCSLTLLSLPGEVPWDLSPLLQSKPATSVVLRGLAAQLVTIFFTREFKTCKTAAVMSPGCPFARPYQSLSSALSL